jgi:hypothetical protein
VQRQREGAGRGLTRPLAQPRRHLPPALRHGDAAGEKAAASAQKLGQLQPFVAVFPQECMANLHILGQPNTFLAADAAHGQPAKGCVLSDRKSIEIPIELGKDVKGSEMVI